MLDQEHRADVQERACPDDRVQDLKNVRRRASGCRVGMSNCFGTGLYSAGVVDTDRFFDTSADSLYPSVSKCLEKMQRSDSPQEAYLIVWMRHIEPKLKTPVHMGVITKVSLSGRPLNVTNRVCTHGTVRNDEPLKDVNKRYSDIDFAIEYYKPARLEEERKSGGLGGLKMKEAPKRIPIV